VFGFSLTIFFHGSTILRVCVFLCFISSAS